jgi:hypothetical protein
MILKAIVEDQEYSLSVPDAVVAGCEAFCTQLDRDMDGGWQMSRDWVPAPTREQRCQIVADKLLSALEKENHKVGVLMAAYLLTRLPNLELVELDVQGEMQNHSFRLRDAGSPNPEASVAAAPAQPAAPAQSAPAASGSAVGAAAGGMPTGLNRMQAMAQAGNEVTKVFKVGKAWRFSVYDHASGAWQDSPLMATEQQAEQLRQAAFKERYQRLAGDA